MPYLKIGHGNVVMAHRIWSMENVTKESIRRIMHKEQNDHRLVDGSAGNRTRTLIFMDSGHVVASAIRKKTLIRRLNKNRTGNEEAINLARV